MNGRLQVEQVVAEPVVVVPAEVTHQVQWDQSSEFLIPILKPAVLGQVADGAIAPVLMSSPTEACCSRRRRLWNLPKLIAWTSASPGTNSCSHERS